MDKVSADTITRLTAEAASVPLDEAPTAEQLIEKIRAELKLKIATLARSVSAHEERHKTTQAYIKSKGLTPKDSPFAIAHAKAEKALKLFEDLIAHQPPGFCLAPVLYSHISAAENHGTYSEFHAVRHKFLTFLAENYADELAAMGICPEGIERMKKGQSPIDADGRLYKINVDHIIERGGGGTLSTTEAVDPDMPEGSTPTFKVNHFKNFILLPTETHERKNDLNMLQDVYKRMRGEASGRSQWVLMLVPEVSPERSGYVAPPQGKPLSMQQKRDYGTALPSTLHIAMGTIKHISRILANSEHIDDPTPMVASVARRLTEAFNDVSRPDQNMDTFVQFYDGKRVQRLLRQVKNMPPEATEELYGALNKIDDELAKEFNGRTRKLPANNNRKPTQQPKNTPRTRRRGNGPRS